MRQSWVNPAQQGLVLINLAAMKGKWWVVAMKLQATLTIVPNHLGFCNVCLFVCLSLYFCVLFGPKYKDFFVFLNASSSFLFIILSLSRKINKWLFYLSYFCLSFNIVSRFKGLCLFKIRSCDLLLKRIIISVRS